MSPDTRHHRGAHPADSELFGPDQLVKLRRAVSELSWLLSRGYNMTSSLKLVGDRDGLRERQRLAVGRSSCSDEDRQRRIEHRIAIEELRGQPVIVDEMSFFRKTIEELETMFRECDNSHEQLKLLAAELVYCERPRAVALRRKVEAALGDQSGSVLEPEQRLFGFNAANAKEAKTHRPCDGTHEKARSL